MLGLKRSGLSAEQSLMILTRVRSYNLWTKGKKVRVTLIYRPHWLQHRPHVPALQKKKRGIELRTIHAAAGCDCVASAPYIWSGAPMYASVRSLCIYMQFTISFTGYFVFQNPRRPFLKSHVPLSFRSWCWIYWKRDQNFSTWCLLVSMVTMADSLRRSE